MWMHAAGVSLGPLIIRKTLRGISKPRYRSRAGERSGAPGAAEAAGEAPPGEKEAQVRPHHSLQLPEIKNGVLR